MTKVGHCKIMGFIPKQKKILLHFLTKKLSKYYEKMCKLFYQMIRWLVFYILHRTMSCTDSNRKIDKFINLKYFTSQKKIICIHRFESHHRISSFGCKLYSSFSPTNNLTHNNKSILIWNMKKSTISRNQKKSLTLVDGISS